MKRSTVHNLIIVDASGSMCSIYDQALEGINKTISNIKTIDSEDTESNQTITLLSFATGGEPLQYIYKETISTVACPISRSDYNLRGCTALYDAIGDSVTELRKAVKRGDNALVTIITDGYENDSKRWTKSQVKSLIDELRQQDWVFTYIGANQDVEHEAEKIGVKNSLKFEATIEGTVKMFDYEAVSRRNWNERRRRGEQDLEEGYFNRENSDNENNISSTRVTPERVDSLRNNEVFVFGSNIEGHHNGGSARAAMQRFGAVYGEGFGHFGQSFAIPTTGTPQVMAGAIHQFIRYALQHPELRFLVTQVGCGNAGWTPQDVAPLFKDAEHIQNITLPRSFWEVIKQ